MVKPLIVPRRTPSDMSPTHLASSPRLDLGVSGALRAQRFLFMVLLCAAGAFGAGCSSGASHSGSGGSGGAGGGGRCGAVTSQATQIEDPEAAPGSPVFLALDEVALYVSHQFRDVVRIPKDGSAAEIIAGTMDPAGVAVDGGVLFYAASDAVVSVPITGGKPKHLADASIPLQVAVDADRVYWTALGFSQKPSGGGGVFSVKKDGSDLARLDKQGQTDAISIGSTLAYFPGHGNPDTLVAAPKGGGSQRVIDTSPAIGYSAFSEGVLFWTRAKQGGPARLTELVRADPDGSNMQVVADAGEELFNIATDEASTPRPSTASCACRRMAGRS
jgi:hypothetical protein